MGKKKRKIPRELADIPPARLTQWAEIGVDRVHTDLVYHGGSKVVGGPHEIIDQAWRWVRYEKARAVARTKAEQSAALSARAILKPSFFGSGIILPRAWAWLKGKFPG